MSASKPAPSFTVTTASEKLTLDESGAARATFTVTNTNQAPLRGRLLIRPRDAAKPEWFTIVGESLRDFAPNGAQQVVVELKVPPGTPPGSYSFRLDAVSEDDPDEDFTEGPSVAFDVAPPPPPPPKKKKFPWWILAIVGAVLLLIIIGIVVFLLVRDGGSDSTTVPVPNVIGLRQQDAARRIADAGLTPRSIGVPVREPRLAGIVQNQQPRRVPGAETRLPRGSVVTIQVGVFRGIG